MKQFFLLAILVPIVSWANEPSKEEMRQNLKRYVHENKEASISIAPLIEKLTAILDAKEEERKKNEADVKKEADSLLKK